METVFIVFRVLTIAGWGWKVARSPTTKERLRKLKDSPQVADFKQRCADAEELRKARSQELSKRIRAVNNVIREEWKRPWN